MSLTKTEKTSLEDSFYHHLIKAIRFRTWMAEGLEQSLTVCRGLNIVYVWGPCSLKKLCGLIGITTSTGSIMIEKLVKQGFVSRDQGTKDRRKIVLTITDQGRKVAEKNYQYCIKQLKTIFSQLEQKDTAKLKSALRMMEEVLTKINVEPGGL